MSLKRRGFLRNAVALAGGALSPQIVRAETLGRGGGVAANSRVLLGHIGTGGRGGRSIVDFMDKEAFAAVENVAFCDVNASAREWTRLKTKAPQSAAFEDFREMLSQVKLDGVVISTPPHWHTPQAIAAVKAGLACYVEKPMSTFISEGRILSDLARAKDGRIQVGSQTRSDHPAITKAIRLCREGKIGELKRVVVLLPAGSKGVPFREEPVPEGLNYDLWLGPAPMKPYQRQRVHGGFHNILDYCGGKLGDWGAHQLDVAQLALGTQLSGPRQVQGSGVFPEAGLYDAPYQFDVECYYPDLKATVLATTDRGKIPEVAATPTVQSALRFEGSEGTLYCDRVRLKASNSLILIPEGKRDGEKDVSRIRHKQNFIDVLLRKAAPAAPVEEGHRSATLCHLCLIATLLKAPLKWNPETEKFEGEHAERANAWTTYPRRGNWYA